MKYNSKLIFRLTIFPMGCNISSLPALEFPIFGFFQRLQDGRLKTQVAFRLPMMPFVSRTGWLHGDHIRPWPQISIHSGRLHILVFWNWVTAPHLSCWRIYLIKNIYSLRVISQSNITNKSYPLCQ